jgi:hypothetical protein
MPERIGEKSKCVLITKGYLATLNQRVQGSSPCAPTNKINGLFAICLNCHRHFDYVSDYVAVRQKFPDLQQG